MFDDAPDAGAWRGVWGSAADDVHVVGDDGKLLYWKQGQAYRISAGAGYDFAGVWGADANEVWAVGTIRTSQRGVIFKRSADAWNEFGTTPLPLKSVWGAGDYRIAVGPSGGIFYGDKTAPFVTGIQAQPNPKVPPSPDAPINWSVSGNSTSAVLVAADVDTFFLFDGASWHAFDDPIDRTRTYRAAWGAPGGGDIFMGANYFGLWRWVGQGQPVFQLNEEKDTQDKFSRYLWGLWGTPDGKYVVAVGDQGRIMTFDVGTQKVATRPSPTTRSLYAVWGSSLDDLWIVGEGGLILRGGLRF